MDETKKKKVKERVNFTLDPEIIKKLRDYSDTTGRPMSQILEIIIDQELTSERLEAIRIRMLAQQSDPITATSDNRHKDNECKVEQLDRKSAKKAWAICNNLADRLASKGLDQKTATEKAVAWTLKAIRTGSIQA